MSLLYLIVSFATLLINRNSIPADLRWVWVLVTITVSAIIFVLETNKNNKGE